MSRNLFLSLWQSRRRTTTSSTSTTTAAPTTTTTSTSTTTGTTTTTTSTSTTTAAPAPRQNLVYIGTFENPSPFSGITPQSCTTPEISQSNTFARVGTYSAKVICNKTDCLIGASIRSEMNRTSSSEPAPPLGRWYGISYLMPTSYVIDTAPEAICQWHEFTGTASPHFSLWTQSGRFRLALNGVAGPDLGAYPLNTWTDFVFHIVWSTTNTGSFEMWKNGVKIDAVTQTGITTMPVDIHCPYWKFGIYKWFWYKYPAQSQTTQRIIYIDEARMGNANATFHDVSPGNYS